MRKITEVELLRQYALKHWPKKGSRTAGQAKEDLARFCGVNTPSITRWLSGSTQPKGRELAKLRFFLKEVGFKIPVLEKLGSTLYRLAQVIVFAPVSMAQIAQELGYKNVQDVYRLVSGDSATVPSREEKINKLHERFVAEIETGRDDLAIMVGHRVPIQSGQASAHSRKRIPAQEEKESVKSELNSDDTLTHVAYLILALLPFAERIASDEFDKEERIQLRQMTGEANAIPRLTDALIKLSGETARKYVLSKEPSDE